jgi:hypothetical protein
MRIRTTVLLFTLLLGQAASLEAQTHIRIMPPDGAILAAGQRMDIRVEATSSTERRRGGWSCGSTAWT